MAKSVFLKAAIDAAKAAEPLMLKHYRGNVKVHLKPDESPVTIADQEVEKRIIRLLRGRFPEHGFFGEESGKQGGKQDYVWIIDPIDGTKNFIRKIPIISTLIALKHKDEVIVGVSNAPLLGELLYAEKGKGSFLNGKRIHVSTVATLSEAMVCFGSYRRFIKAGLADRVAGLIDAAKRDRGFGDFYQHHLVATGRAEVAIEPGIHFWDIAALQLIIEEAGGRVTELDGQKISESTSLCFSSNGKLHPEILRFFKT